MGIPKIANRVWTPWGIADSVEEIISGVKRVATPTHGGLMVDPSKVFMSELAHEVSTNRDGILFFEEDVIAHVAILELGLPGYDKHKSVNTLAYFHMDYIKRLGLESKVSEDTMKRALAREAELKKRQEGDPDLLIAAVPMNLKGQWLAYSADQVHIYVCEGNKVSNTISDNTILCCISDLIDQLGKKSVVPILTENLGRDTEKLFLKEVGHEKGGTLIVNDTDSAKLKVNLTLVQDDRSKKAVELSAENHELIRTLVLAFK